MDVLAELRLAFRRLWKAPGFTLSAVLILGLALGANTAIFEAVDAVLLHPLPVSGLDRLVVGWARDPAKNAPVVELSYRTFERWAARTRSFSHIAAFGSSPWPMTFFGSGGSAPIRLSSAGVSASFFDTLGIRPALGRCLGVRGRRRVRDRGRGSGELHPRATRSQSGCAAALER